MIRGLMRVLGSVANQLWTFARLPLQLLVALLILAALAIAAWEWYWRDDGSMPEAASALLARSMTEACAGVPVALPTPDRALRPLLILPLADDRNSLVTGKLRDSFAGQDWYQLVEKGRVEQIIDALYEAWGKPREPVTDPSVAIELAEDAPAEVVVIGRVQRLEPLDGGFNVSIHLQAIEVDSGQLLLDDTFSNLESSTAAPGSYSFRLAALLGLASFALIWPALTIPVMRRVVRMESNAATLITILLITAVPALASWPIVFGGGTGVWRAVGFCVVVLLAGFWCMVVMAWVAERDN